MVDSYEQKLSNINGKTDQSSTIPKLDFEVSATCPVDGTILEANNLTWFFRFPEDADSVVEALTYRLNERSCPLCKTIAQITIPVVVINTIKKCGVALATGNMEAKILEILAGQGFPEPQIAIVGNYDELRMAMLPWLNEYQSEVLFLFVTGGISVIEKNERLRLLQPLQLMLLRLTIDGVLTLGVSLNEEIENRIKRVTGKSDINDAIHEILPRQLAGTIYQLGWDIFQDALEKNRLSDVFADFVKRFPTNTITPLTLESFSEDCKPLSDIDQEKAEFVRMYHSQMLNSMVYSCAGEMNPRSAEWAQYLWYAWQWYDADPEQMPRSLLPSAVMAPQFTRFEDLWSIVAPAILNTAKGPEIKANIEKLTNMLETFGFGERFGEMVSAGLVRIELDAKEDPEKHAEFSNELVKLSHDYLINNHAFNSSIEMSIEMGRLVGGGVRNLIVNGMTDGAVEFAGWIISDALQEQDYVAAYTTCSSAVNELNRTEAWRQSAKLLQPLMAKFNDEKVGNQLEKAGAGLTVEFFNQAGNTFRYLGNFEGALSTYKIAKDFLTLVTDEGRRKFSKSVLTLNEARVYRDMRNYGIAFERFVRHLDKEPGDVEVQHGLAILFLNLNRLEEANHAVNKAIAASNSVTHAHEHASLLVTRAMIKARRGLCEQAAVDLEEAERIVPPDARSLRLRIAALVGLSLSDSKVYKELLERAENRLSKGILQKSRLQTTAMAALGTLLLNQGRLEDAMQFDKDYLTTFLESKQIRDVSWELKFLKGRLERLTNSAKSGWPWYEAALEVLEEKIPNEEDSAYSVTWLADKEAFQAELADVAVHLVESGEIDASKLLSVYEFTNGRALGARLAKRAFGSKLPSHVTEIIKVAANQRKRHIVVFMFVDAGETVHLYRVSSTDPTLRPVADAVFQKEKMQKQSNLFISSFAEANPAMLDALDRRLESWWEFLREMGLYISDELEDNCEVCFLPGRHLTSQPLHLIPLPNGDLLIEHHPVVFSANLTLLFDQQDRSKKLGGDSLVVSVAKGNDTNQFRWQLDSETTRLIEKLEQQGRKVQRLDATAATINSVTSALTKSEKAFFLCHGVHGGRIKGYGICLSDGKRLPPALLSVDDAPEFARFVLGWDDLEQLRSAPLLVVSIACSSGRTVVAPGGVRLGLEQTLFSAGTRSIVSPLWPVDQEASLAWVDSFESACSNYPDAPYSEAHRSACLEIKKRYQHPYFWAPFILTGSLFGEKS